MIPIIGVMIGLYIVARYAEMQKSCGLRGKILLGILIIVNIFLMIGLLSKQV